MNFYWKTFGFFSSNSDTFFFYKDFAYFNALNPVLQESNFFIKKTFFNKLTEGTFFTNKASLIFLKKKINMQSIFLYKIFWYLKLLKSLHL